MLQRGEPLYAPKVGSAERADLACAPTLHRTPFYCVIAVARVVAIRDEFAIRIAAPSHVHPDDHIAMLDPVLETFNAPGRGERPVIRRAREDDGKARPVL